LGLVASLAATIGPDDVVLEPSAGTGLLAVFAEMRGARLALNEIADVRAALLRRLFPMPFLQGMTPPVFMTGSMKV
jgi:hypothetical protein